MVQDNTIVTGYLCLDYCNVSHDHDDDSDMSLVPSIQEQSAVGNNGEHALT